MKWLLLMALVLVGGFSSPAESFPLEGIAFKPGTTPIEWKATIQRKKLWVYKTVPQYFSNAVVSNALAVGSFRSFDFVNGRDKELLRFQDNKRDEKMSRELEISPTFGWMRYRNSKAIASMTQAVEGVPDFDEVERQGLELLLKLGIDRTQIAPPPRPTGDAKRSRLLKTGEEADIEVEARHICFIRQIDGIPFAGNGLSGGLWIDFGNRSEIAQFELTWRNLIPFELREVASADKLVGLIEGGKAVFSGEISLKGANKLTVKSIRPYYLGKMGTEPQTFVYPIASMRVEAHFQTNSVEFEVVSHILSDTAIPK